MNVASNELGNTENIDFHKKNDSVFQKIGNTHFFNEGWQFPAVTEKHALEKILQWGDNNTNFVYIGFPWATIIDKISWNTPDCLNWAKALDKFSNQIESPGKRVTVCQHINMKNYIHLLEKCRIDCIFWSHATNADLARASGSGPIIRSFPLFPVQIVDQTPSSPATERPYLFSFVGAKSNKYYLSRVRNWILDLLKDEPDALIVGRDKWHYQKVVYDHQVVAGQTLSDDVQGLINQSASAEFFETLNQSVFSLCPSGTGPNSIRLWESIGCGSIPVILSDEWAPPGDQELWDAATIFCREDIEEVRELPALLRSVAADAEKLQDMRQAMRQLWLLYGHETFVYDIEKFKLGQEPLGTQEVALMRLKSLARMVLSENQISDSLAQRFVILTASIFLTKQLNADGMVTGDDQVDAALQVAVQQLEDDQPSVAHLRNVINLVSPNESANTTSPRSAMINRGALPKLCLWGSHSNRTPLAYTPYRRMAEGKFTFTEKPEGSDIVIGGFKDDFARNSEQFSKYTKDNTQLKILIISEEPLWDSMWSGDIHNRNHSIVFSKSNVKINILNHFNSKIFDFNIMPYFLTTNDDFTTRYRMLLKLELEKSPTERLKAWEEARYNSAFVAEYRNDSSYDLAFPEKGIWGLSNYRTQVAKTLAGASSLTIGKDWKSTVPRQRLPDWHLDKLVTLRGNAYLVSAYENTHVKNYISEKIFDAYTVGSLPIFFASPDHRIFQLVPEGSFVNTFGEQPTEAASMISSMTPNLECAKLVGEAMHNLSKIFSNNKSLELERERTFSRLMSEIETILGYT